MAKKVVASFRDASKARQFTKVIRTVKTEAGSYSFKEEIVPAEQVKDYIKEANK